MSTKFNLTENPDILLEEFLVYVYKNLNELSGGFNDMQLKQMLDYLNDTMFIHFDLYKYVFTYEREAIQKIEEKIIVTPPKENFQDNNFSSAKRFHIWEYENKISEIERKEKEANRKFLERRLNIDQENELPMLNSKNEFQNKENLNEEILSNLIDSISMPILNKTSKLIKNESEEIKENILIHLEKISLLRPEELGNSSIDDLHDHFVYL